MKFDPSKLSKAAKAWTAKHGKFVFPCIVAVFVLAVIVVNGRAFFARGSDSPKVTTQTVSASTSAAPTPKVARAPAAEAIPHIAQQPSAPAVAAPVVATASVAAVPVAAPIQPPAGIRPGFMLQKNFQQAQFGLAQTSADVVSVQTLSVQAQATDGDGERAVEWNAWFYLTKPTTIAWVRLAGGEGTVSVTIDGTALGEAVDHWSAQGAYSNLASIPLAIGWHQIVIHDTRRSWVKGAGVAVRIDLGDGTGAVVSPQPWATLPGTTASSPIPHIAQHEPASASTAPTAKPAASTTAGSAP